MEKNKTTDNSLSITRFKDMDVETMSDADFQDYVIANLMQKVLQTLEGTIHSDRVFYHARTQVFSACWEARDRFAARRDKE